MSDAIVTGREMRVLMGLSEHLDHPTVKAEYDRHLGLQEYYLRIVQRDLAWFWQDSANSDGVQV